MVYGEILKTVFPLLDGVDLASCIAVCKQWRDVGRDEYLWKCLCAKKWPSICKRSNPPTVTYYKLYQTFYKRQNRRALPPPRLSFDVLEFFIDIWADENLIFSEVVPGPLLQAGTSAPPPGTGELFRFHNEGPDYKMTIPVVPRFRVPSSQAVSVSVLVVRKDSNRVASILNKSNFDYIDRTARRALAFGYLDLSPEHPFISSVRGWMSLLFVEDENDGALDVFGIQMDFCDVATSRDEVLWLLDILDWK